MRIPSLLKIITLICLLSYTPFISSAHAAEQPAPKVSPLAVAKAKFEKLDATANDLYEKNQSLEMARAATREIALSSRDTVDRAINDLLVSRERLSYASAKDRAMLAKQADAKLATVRAATHRMIKDHEVANFANDVLTPSQYDYKAAIRVSRDAELKFLQLEAAAADRLAKNKPSKQNNDLAKAAHQAIAETKAIAAWENQQWGVLQILNGTEREELNNLSAKLAAQVAKLETDSGQREIFKAYIPLAKQKENVGKKLIATTNKAMQQAQPNAYTLRTAAMGGLKPLNPAHFDYTKARHLLVRAGFGGTPQQIKQLQAMGLYKAVDYLVDYHAQPSNIPAFSPERYPINDPYLTKVKAPFLRGRINIAQREGYAAQIEELRKWWITNMVQTTRPLQEKMTLFWHSHFATQFSVVNNSHAMYIQNQLFRDRATDNFGGLLYEIVHDPVMLRFLDNNTNTKGHPNENLAREIMELFAMGAYQGYDENDVKEAARALTGYNFDQTNSQYRYLISKHDQTPKTIFGKKGPFTGDDLVRLILQQPATSRFIAQRLYQFFAHIEPDAPAINQLASLLKANKFEIKPTLKNLFLSQHFYSTPVMGTQIKSPVDLTVGSLRTLGVKKINDAAPLVLAIREMGQDLFEPPDVKGWRAGRSWVNSTRLFTRYNEISSMIRNIKQIKTHKGINAIGLAKKAKAQTPETIVDTFSLICFGEKLPNTQRQQLITFLDKLPPQSQWKQQHDNVSQKLQSLLVLMTSNPDYQLH